MHTEPIVIESEEESQMNQQMIQLSDNEEPNGFIQFSTHATLQKVIKSEQITPWMRNKTIQIRDPMLRFHNQIIDFYNFIRPHKQTHTLKYKAFSKIKELVTSTLPGVKVFAFGSFATKLYLPDADIDVGILTNGQYDTTQAYNALNKVLEKQPAKYTQLQYIRKSKVPLIKFVCAETGIQFDLSIDKVDGFMQLKYVEKMIKNYPQFKYLVFLFKCMLKVRSLAETYTGGVGSFLLFCMILIYLYETHRSKKYYTLSQHVIKFMHFYGQTDWSNKVIYGREGIIGEKPREIGSFSFISPQDETHDIGKAAFKIKDVFNLFRNRGRYLTGKNFEPKESILKALINPNNEAFKYCD